MQKLAPKQNETEIDKDLLDEMNIGSDFDSVNVIGDGAYGVVYKARDKSTGNFVALKRIRMSFTQDGIPSSALREISTLKQLNAYNHPNIVRLFDICYGRQREESIMLFLIFEHVDSNLAEYMETHLSPEQMGPNEARNFAQQLLSGLDFLHCHRVIHRDIKPQNILVTNNGLLKIADFGLARIYDNQMKMTSLVQTLWYRAPEVILSQFYSMAIDVWACGCIIAEMHTKRPLFSASSEVEQLDRIFQIIGTPNENNWPDNVSLDRSTFMDYPRVCLRSIIKNLTNNASELIMKMLSFDPKRRITARNCLAHEYFNENNN